MKEARKTTTAADRHAVQRQSNADVLPLFEYSNVVNSSLDLKFILDTVLRTLMGKMLTSKGVVLLQQSAEAFSVIASRGVTLHDRTIPVTARRPSLAIASVLSLKDSPLKELYTSAGIELNIPVVSNGHVLGFIGLGKRLPSGTYSPADKKLIQSLVNLSGTAIDKAYTLERMKEANRNLDRKFQELNTLFDLSKEFNVGLDGTRVLRLLTLAILGQVGVKTYAVCLREDDHLRIKASRMRDETDIASAMPQLALLKKATLIEDMFRQKSLRDSAVLLAKAEIKAVVPMHIQGDVRGALLLGERLRGGVYSEQDLEFLYALGNLAIISIENARLFSEAIEKQRMEDELNIAREIQQGLLPETLPAIEGFDIAAVNVSSKQVGGDYYDVVLKSDHEYILAIGDVSGKGAPAALLMANVQAVLRSLGPLTNDIAATTGRINNLVCDSIRGSSKFITFFWGTLNTLTREFAYVNAGHNPPLVVREGKPIEKLEKGGLLLGIFPTDEPYASGTVKLHPGDLLLLYTDGVSEAMNAAGEEFGDDHLERLAQQHAPRSAADILSTLQHEIRKHTGDTPQSDDITLLILKAR